MTKIEYPRIVFMGTPDFAVASLKALLDANFNVVGVITAPDKPAGRGQQLKQSPVKEFALEHNLPLLQPEKLKNPEFIEELRALKADLQIVVAFRMLPEVVWNMPPIGTFNLHASLLPQYRGAAPINWAIINGEKESGVTTFFLQQEIDTGNIIFSGKTEITEDDCAGTLHDKLMNIGSELVVKTVNAIITNAINPFPQPDIEGALKSAPKIFKEDCKINWEMDALQIINKVRGLSPYPAAWSDLFSPNGSATTFKIFKAKATNETKLKAGEVDTDGKTYIRVGSATSDIELIDIQIAGKKHMEIKELLRGFKLELGAKTIQ